MKRINKNPRALVFAIAIALGFTAVGTGCTPDYDNSNSAQTAPAGDNAAGDANSNQPVSDTWITTKVKASLASMNDIDNTDIDVETNNGVVTLSGVARSADQVTDMKDAAMDVDGVTRVDAAKVRIGAYDNNRYAENDESMDAVTENSQAPVEDTWITTKVLAKLQTVDDLDNTDIKVETSNGIVTLSGRADSQAMVDAAVRAIKTIDGVKSVNTSVLKVGHDKPNL